MVASELLASLTRRTIRSRLLTAAAAFAVIAIGLGLFHRPVLSYMTGPVTLDVAAIANLTPASNNYVTITGDRIVDTGFQQVTKDVDRETRETKRERVEGYHLLQLGDRYLLVRAAENPGTTVTGVLRDVAAKDTDRKVYTQLTADPADPVALLPLVLESTDALRNQVLAILVIAAALALFGVWHIVFALRARGTRASLEARLAALEARNETLDVISPDRVWAGRELAIARSLYRVQLVAFQDVVWAYQRVNETNDGVEIEVAIQTRSRQTLAIRVGHEYHSQALLERIEACEPSVLLGFDDRIRRMSFAERLAEVDAGRRAADGAVTS